MASRIGMSAFMAVLFLMSPLIGHAAGVLPRPTGEVVLSVTGSIRNTNAPGSAEFDVAMLENIGKTTLRTSTAWTAGPAVFEGVLARDLLKAVGADGENVEATALNDYVVSIPMADVTQYDVMLALKMDGEYLKVRDKGPIWIVYPRDQHSELQDPKTDKKWIWQLCNIRVN